MRLQITTQKAVLDDQQLEIDSLSKENNALGSSLSSVRNTLKKTKEEFEERIRRGIALQESDLENELIRTKERLGDSENRRNVLALQLLSLQKDVETLSKKATGTKGADNSAHTMALEQEVAKLRNELSSVKERNCKLVQELADTKKRLEENESETQHAILRKQLDGILKEKQTVHPQIDNVEGHKFDESIGSRGISETRSQKKANPSDYRSEQVPATNRTKDLVRPTPKIVESGMFHPSDEDQELLTKVHEYFERKYPGVSIEQTSKSKPSTHPDSFEIDGTSMVFRISSGSLSVKTGGSFLPLNQYFALNPLEKKRGAKILSPTPARVPTDKYESAPRPNGNSRSPVPSASGSRRRP
jgi:predicted  nucleic acid-binding Zn-ribbon protein